MRRGIRGNIGDYFTPKVYSLCLLIEDVPRRLSESELLCQGDTLKKFLVGAV